jgi:hypothetical protein
MYDEQKIEEWILIFSAFLISVGLGILLYLGGDGDVLISESLGFSLFLYISDKVCKYLITLTESLDLKQLKIAATIVGTFSFLFYFQHMLVTMLALNIQERISNDR